MNPTQQSWYYQVPGAYPLDEDEYEEEDPYLQMMNDIAEEECMLGLGQSQYTHTSGFSGYQHQYASHNMPTPRSGYEMSVNSRQEYAPQISSARWSSHQERAERHHPYMRPNEPMSKSNHWTSPYQSHQTMQTGPIRHGRNALTSHGSTYSQARFGNKDASAQQYFPMGNEGYTRPNQSAYELCNLDFAEYQPMTAPISQEQHKIPSPQEEVEEPKKSYSKRASQAQVSFEEKKPAKPRTKCQTRIKNGQLECRIDYGGRSRKWEPAIRMDDCRRSLIDQQNDLAAQLGMKYRDPDPVGTGVDDETAFKPEHADWGPDRAHLPAICWRFEEDEENNPRPSNNPGYMRFEGMVVLDPNDDPVKDWPQLPLTLSSKTRGYRLEIMSRENPHIEYRDFLARMPSAIEKLKKNDNGNTEMVLEAPDANAVCNMRMLRFRREKGMLSWTQKGNTKLIGEGLEKLFGNKLINNSMWSFGRNLTPQEQAEIKKGSNARFPKTDRTAATTTSATTRARTNNDIAAKTPKQPGNTEKSKSSRQKRAREDDDEDLDSADDEIIGQATAASYRKRRCNARGEVAKPEQNLDSYYDPVATVNPQDLIKVPSDPTSEASSDLSDDEYRDEEGSESEDDDDDDESDGEYETSTPHRQIHPLPARRTRGDGEEANNNPLPDSTHSQDHDSSNSSSSSTDENVESQSKNETDHDEENDSDNDMTNDDDEEEDESSADESKEASQASIPVDRQEQPIVAATNEEEAPPPPVIRQETDLERHRRKMRELLGEEDDYYWLPEAPPPWMSEQLFPPHVPE